MNTTKIMDQTDYECQVDELAWETMQKMRGDHRKAIDYLMERVGSPLYTVHESNQAMGAAEAIARRGGLVAYYDSRNRRRR